VARVGVVACQLQLPAGARLHDVFHVRLLKKYCGEEPTGPDTLPPIRHGRACLEPEEATKSCLARGCTEVVVRWAGQPAVSTSWVDIAEFRQLYPTFKLADKLVVQGGRDVMYGVWYSRRPKASANKAPETNGSPHAGDQANN
jgi:hypothetical protein